MADAKGTLTADTFETGRTEGGEGGGQMSGKRTAWGSAWGSSLGAIPLREVPYHLLKHESAHAHYQHIRESTRNMVGVAQKISVKLLPSIRSMSNHGG
jgi:hypothetical protein